MKLLEGKVVLVTGASKGIGKATAVIFAEQGAKLVINGRNQQALCALADELAEVAGSRPELAVYDVSVESEVKQAFQMIQKQYKKLDVLINNAGVMDDALLGMIRMQQLETMMSANLFGTIYHMQYAARLMQRQQAGSIINFSSIIGRVGSAGHVVYGASKAGVIGATMSAAKELARYNIRVNVIAPGFIDTDMVRQLTEKKFAEQVNNIAMRRIGKPSEVANVALFLASDMSSYVTGQVVGVDGGMLI